MRVKARTYVLRQLSSYQRKQPADAKRAVGQGIGIGIGIGMGMGMGMGYE